jgi:hypothetical protein
VNVRKSENDGSIERTYSIKVEKNKVSTEREEKKRVEK